MSLDMVKLPHKNGPILWTEKGDEHHCFVLGEPQNEYCDWKLNMYLYFKIRLNDFGSDQS